MNVDKEQPEFKKSFDQIDVSHKTDGQFQRLIEHLGVGVVVHRPDTAIIFANEVACDLLGVEFNEAPGKVNTDPLWYFVRQDLSRIPVEDFPVNQVLRTRKQMKSQIIGFVHQNQENPVWVLCNAYPEFDNNDEISQVVVNFTNISEQIHLKEKLSDLYNLFQGAMDQSQAGIGIAEALKSGREFITWFKSYE